MGTPRLPTGPPANDLGYTLSKLEARDIRWLHQLSHGFHFDELDREPTEYAIRHGRASLTTVAHVKNRMRAIRQFMRVETTTQAVAEAMRRGLIA